MTVTIPQQFHDKYWASGAQPTKPQFFHAVKTMARSEGEQIRSLPSGNSLFHPVQYGSITVTGSPNAWVNTSCSSNLVGTKANQIITRQKPARAKQQPTIAQIEKMFSALSVSPRTPQMKLGAISNNQVSISSSDRMDVDILKQCEENHQSNDVEMKDGEVLEHDLSKDDHVLCCQQCKIVRLFSGSPKARDPNILVVDDGHELDFTEEHLKNCSDCTKYNS